MKLWQSGLPLVALAAVVALAADAGAQTGFGRATIDGVRGVTEWANADARPIFTGPFAGSTVYLMNDGDDLFIGIEVAGDADLTVGDMTVVRFDNDLDLVLTQNDDEVGLSSTTYADRYFDLGLVTWGVLDPSQDGLGAVGRAVFLNFFELSKPLASGDLRDFDLQGGDVVGFCLQYFENGPGTTDGTYPTSCVLGANEQGLYDTVAVVPPLSGFGTPTLDGVKSPGEWASAATRTVFGGPYAGSTLYVMNDDQTVYVALEVQGDADLTDLDQIEVRFDEDLDLVLTVGDDAFQWGQAGSADLHWSNPYVLDLLQHGQGAAGRSAGVNFLEISKPLASGDPDDIALGAGDRAGLCIRYFDNAIGSGFTNYPPSCVLTSEQQLRYDLIEVASAPPALPSLAPAGLAGLALLLLIGGAAAIACTRPPSSATA